MAGAEQDMKSKSITIISHCFCPPVCDIYAQHMKWQVASLIRCERPIPVQLIICHATYYDDLVTNNMLRRLLDETRGQQNLRIESLVLDKNSLCRRAIGRNTIAKQCDSDIVWFSDTDYAVGPRCITSMAELISPDDELCCPEFVQENLDHATGDRMLDANRNVLLPEIDPSLFKPRRRKFCIGGLQIVGGNTARKGYLDGTKWTQPVNGHKGWHQTNEDSRYRKGKTTKILPIEDLYWIRHSARVSNEYQKAEFGD